MGGGAQTQACKCETLRRKILGLGGRGGECKWMSEGWWAMEHCFRAGQDTWNPPDDG